jgi:hypothetical protein
LHLAPVRIRYGQPVYPGGDYAEMTAEVRRRIAEMLAEMRAEPQAS